MLGPVARLDAAACRGHDPELWFVEGRGRAANQARTTALAICDACPVIGPCLSYALAIPWLVGVWGGTLPTTRERMRGLRKDQP